LSVFGAALAWHGAGLLCLVFDVFGFLGFRVWSAFPAGGNFLFWQKRKSPKKVA
jgi:hypothetical protein